MTDVRKAAHSAVSVIVLFLLIFQLWKRVLFPGPLYINYAWPIWVLAVLCIGSLAYLIIRNIIRIFVWVFGVRLDKAPVQEALIYWCVMSASMFIAYHFFPQLLDEIRYLNTRWFYPGNYNWEIARYRLMPFEYFRLQTIFLYGVFCFTIIAGLVLAALRSIYKIKGVYGYVWLPQVLLIAVSMLAFSGSWWHGLDDIWGLYRIWTIYHVLALVSLLWLYNKIKTPGSGPIAYIKNVFDEHSLFDAITLAFLLIVTMLVLLAVFISLAIFVYNNLSLLTQGVPI